MERKQKASTESFVLLAVVAGIFVALNVLSYSGLSKRYDTTQNQRYTLSKGSGNLLKRMKQDMRIEAYVTKGLPKLDAFTRDLRDLLQEYKDSAPGKFDYRMIEAKTDDEKKAAQEAGLQPADFGEASAKDEAKGAVAQGYMGLVFKYGSEKEVIPIIPPGTDGIEFWISNKIREVVDKVDDVKHKIGLVTGKDEIKLDESNLVPTQAGKISVKEVLTRNFPFYTFIDVDLKDGNTAIQDELDGIVITQPGKDYSEKELRQIDAFLLKGKSVTVIASAVNVKPSDPSMNATLSTHGLEKLLDGYGIEMKKDAVLEFYYAFRVPIMTQSGIASAVVPTIVHSHEDPRFQGNEQLLDTGYPIFFRMPEVMFPFASTLVTNPSKQPDAKMTVLARTTPKSIALTGETAELKPFQRWTQKGTPEQRVISVAMEGTFKTAFPTGDKQGVVTPEKGAPGKLLVISSAQFLANPFARAGNGPDMPQMHGMQMPGMGGDQELLRLAGPYANNALKPTILAFKNVLDWMSGDIDLLAASAKILGEPQLSYGDLGSFKFDENETPEQAKKRAEELKDMRKRQQSSTEWILILGIPLLLAAFGGLRWRMRQASRENAVLA